MGQNLISRYVGIKPSIISWALYFIGSWSLLYPILVTPLVADDFLNPFLQYSSTGGGYWDSVVFGWDAAFNGASMRLAGNVAGALLINLWIDLAGHSLIGLSAFYAMQKYVVFILCGLSLAYFSGAILLALGHKTSLLKRTFLCSFVLFSTLQIHGLWSNDPVSSYPMTGFLVAAIGFSILGWAAYTSLNPSISRLFVLLILCVLSVFYYEILVSIGLLTFPILLSSISRSKWWRHSHRILIFSVPALATFLTITFSRMHSAAQSQAYSGTAVLFGEKSFRTFYFGLASSLPASAWQVTSEFLGRGFYLQLFPTLTAIAAMSVALWHFPKISELTRISNHKNSFLLASLILSSLGFWAFAVGLQSLTEKVQNETGKLGYVYSFYAIGAATFAVLISITLILLSHTSIKIKTMVFTVLLAFSTIQSSITWNTSEHMSLSLVPNRTLLREFSNFEVMPLRCQALRNWAAGNWPSYYEDNMIIGLQNASMGFHKEPFCSNFQNP